MITLYKIILYGSYARGDFTPDSDVDVMLLVDLPEDRLDESADMLSEIGFDYNVAHDNKNSDKNNSQGTCCGMQWFSGCFNGFSQLRHRSFSCSEKWRCLKQTTTRYAGVHKLLYKKSSSVIQ